MLKTEGYENSELFMSLTPKNGVKASKLYSYKPTNGNGDFVWSRNSTAYRMNQSGVLELMGINVPRVDYSNTCPELLIEKSSTNLLLRSQEFNNASWNKANVTVTPNSVTAPDGTLTADTITSLSTGQSNVNQNYPIVINTDITLSLYVKYIDSPYFILTFYDGGLIAARSWFNIQNNTLGTINNGGFTNINRTIENVSNGWARITFSATMPTNTGNLISYLELSSSDGVISSNNGQSAYIWGAQLEESEYATSYIPTTNTTQTRPQDVCYNTANGYGDAQFSIVTRIRLNNVGTSTFEPLLTLSDGTSDIYLCIYTDGNNKLYFDWFNIAPQFVYDTASFANGIVNIGLSYNDSTGDYIIVINGTLEDSGNVGVSIAGAFTGTINRLDLGSLAGGGSPDGDRIIGVQYFNTALIQSDLENLTL